jgi:NAD-reducing hydrogenase small subunit
MTKARKPKVATVWLDGCSGCHMSFLDMDERLIDLADKVDIVYSPVIDPKEFPPDVDVTLVEGAVSSEEDLHKIQLIRERTKILIALGDCAVTGNVPSMRNPYTREQLFDRAYVENAASPHGRKAPDKYVPPLLSKAQPLHEWVAVDLFLPGCPPPADAIHFVITELLAGRTPDPGEVSRFGL